MQPSNILPIAPSQAGKMAALRALLAEKFAPQETPINSLFPTGLPAFDAEEGGIRRGAVTELVGPVGGNSLFIEAMLAALRQTSSFGALIESGQAFDPRGAESRALRRLLWVRCPTALLAIKATDLLLRDGNLGLVLLDLQGLAPRELRGIPTSTWHRFHRLAEPTGLAFVILTAQPLVEGASVRIVLRQRWTLAAMRERRPGLWPRLAPQFFIRRTLQTLPDLREYVA